jgi:hypothetical protein
MTGIKREGEQEGPTQWIGTQDGDAIPIPSSHSYPHESSGKWKKSAVGVECLDTSSGRIVYIHVFRKEP